MLLWDQEDPLTHPHLRAGVSNTSPISAAPRNGEQVKNHSNNSGPAVGPEEHRDVRGWDSIKRKHLIHPVTRGTSKR